jgi:hypothetical protein
MGANISLKYLGPAKKMGTWAPWIPEETNNFKYADIDFAYKNSTDFVRSFLSSVELAKKKHQLVDVKTINMKMGQYPCLPGWHTDCSMFPSSEHDDDVNILYSSGVTRTAFLSQDWECKIRTLSKPSHQEIKSEVNLKIKQENIPYYQIDDNDIVSYTRMHVHAPMPAEKDGYRILIRVTCTDLVIPNNKIIKR